MPILPSPATNATDARDYLPDALNDFDAAVTAAQADIVAAEADIDALEADVATAQSDINALESDVAVLESQVPATNEFLMDSTASTGSAPAIWNIRAQGVSPAKALIRVMPTGAFDGDKSEITLMGEDIDEADRWWADFKVSSQSSTLRRLHILSDREGTEEPITRVNFEIDGRDDSTLDEEFSVVRNGWVGDTESGSGSGVFMLRIIGGTGVTRLEQGSIYLSTGNLILGTSGGDTVIRDEKLRPYAADVTHLGGDGNERFVDLYLRDFIDLQEMGADAAAPGANEARLYTKDNGSGKTQLIVRFNTGAVQVLATEP